jgi:hypothetical protein
MLGSLKYALAAVVVWFVGALFFGGALNFINTSEPAQLRVVDVEAQRRADGLTHFRPVFTLAAGKAPAFAGHIWSRPAAHQTGDVVAGRYNSKTGEMRSDKMLTKSKWLGRFAQVLAVFMGLQAVAVLLGVPERALPLRLRMGAPRRVWA